MAIISRLIAFLLIAFSSGSYALTVESDPFWLVPSYSVKPTPEAACQAHDSARGLIFDSVASDTRTTRKCMSRWPSDTTSSWRNTAAMVCDTSMGSLNTSKLKCVKTVTVCPDGTVDVDGVCISQPCPPAGVTEGDSSNAYQTTSKVPANNVCIGSCSWSAGGSVPSVCANGKCYYYGPFTSNGSSCTGEGGAPAPPEADPSPPSDSGCVSKGQCPGTFNGTFMCVPCGSKEGTTSESGSTSSESTDSSGAPSGSSGPTDTTKETTANCTGNSCNVTTTTHVTNPDGSTTTTTESETTPQADFCKSNPGHVVCKGEDEGTFGGTCASDFQCSGDAVQCAQAREVAKLRCVFDVSPDDPLAVAGGLAMNDELTPAGHPGAPGGGVTVNVMEKIDTTPAFGSSGNCIGDRTFSVVGMSLTLPFASMCPYFNMIGNVFLACCYLVAGFIVFRR